MQATDPDWLASKFEGRYRNLREIGRGGWGVVYVAEDLRHPRRVAIKLLLTSGDSGTSGVRFRQEIATEAQLEHPFIVPLHESGEVDGTPYFVMAYVEGGSLSERIKSERQLPVRDAIQIAAQVAEALAHAHERNVVHRDIKPDNILLGDGIARVADFGIARQLQPTTGDVRITEPEMRLGTPAYMSPEQAAEPELVDGRSDIYSLGCVLFEMLTGHPPYRARTLSALIGKHLQADVPSARRARPDVPQELDDIVRRAMAKSPADRFSSAAELRLALAAVAASEHPSGPQRLRLPATLRGRLAVTALAAALFATAATFAEIGFGADTTGVAADTTRLLVLPLGAVADQRPIDDGSLRRAFARWQGLSIVDDAALSERLGLGVPSTRRVARLAKRYGAGRYVRAEVSSAGGKAHLRVALFAADGTALPLAEGTAPLDGDATTVDSMVRALVDRLLLREYRPASDALPRTSTSLPAVQLYLAGRHQVLHWELDAAGVALDSAWRTDAAFSEAALWLALVRYWQQRPPGTWRSAAQSATVDSAGLTAMQQLAAKALLAVADGRFDTGCATWDQLTVQAPFDWWPWYSAGLCYEIDRVVLPDRRSPSGWRFRSSYHHALQQYQRAFQLAPNLHRGFQSDGFDRIRTMLFVNANSLRRGRSIDGRASFGARPELDADTLLFVPYPSGAGGSIAGSATRSSPGVARMLQRQRELFRQMALAWVAADPQSPSALEGLALALQLLGDPAALDTADAALRRAPTPTERVRVAATAAWIQARFAIPDDLDGLRRARALADTILAADGADAAAQARMSVAALTGRVAAAVSIAAARRPADERLLGPGVARLVDELILRAAFGAADARVPLLAQRIDSALALDADSAQRQLRRLVAYSRAAPLAWPTHVLPALTHPGLQSDYLAAALGASVRADSASVAAAIATIRALRAQVPPAAVSIDALVSEAELLARHGFEHEAMQWLDAGLLGLRTAAPDFDPINAAALGRAMALRASLAAGAGDSAAARRWAAAVVALWEDASDGLQPVVQSMRALMR